MKKYFKWIILITLLVGAIWFIFGRDNYKDKLLKIGYNSNEVRIILKNVPKNKYDKVVKKHYDGLINLITSKGYKANNFDKYLEYYDKNKKADIDNIITIVNSGYDLMDYPASKLLSDLVSSKYYIFENTARYLDYGNEKDESADRVISVVNANGDKSFYSDTKESNLDDDNLVLVNKFYHLPDGYEPSDLVVLTSKYNSGKNSSMRKEAADAFMKMSDGAMLDGITLKNASAYRSYNYQVSLYDGYVKRDGSEKADIYSARPGYSEHQTGLCTDINIIDSSFDNTKEAQWLRKNAYKYGFILRFPKGKEKITGYEYESWHYRYVGEKAAKIIYEDDLTLEEYYAYYVDKKS